MRFQIRDLMPELLCVALVLGFWLVWPTPLRWIGEQYASLDVQYRIGPSALMGALAWWFLSSKLDETLFPAESTGASLQKWNQYALFRQYLYVGTSSLVLSAAVLLVLAFSGSLLLKAALGALVTGAALVGVVSAGTMFLARNRLKGLLLGER